MYQIFIFVSIILTLISSYEVAGTLLHETRHETISTHLSHSNTYQYRQNYKKNLNFFRLIFPW